MSTDRVDPAAATKPAATRAGRWRWRTGLAWLALLAGALLVWLLGRPDTAAEVPFSVLQDRVAARQVQTITVDPDGGVVGEFTDGTAFRSRVPVALDSRAFTDALRTAKVEVRAEGQRQGSILLALVSLLPFLVLLGVIVWFVRRARTAGTGGLSGLSGFGRAHPRIIDAERPATTFDDVAGYDGVKEEVGEIVEFLRDPARFAAAGAQGPRGVIMVGPPGTGKTLLARAVAGQASVPFLSVTGSAFVEMFVGVGASRVRDLFTEARKRAPSIIFIDEIDAIGGRRGAHLANGNDERDQTLNQLLAEMDGFDGSSGVVVLAATNRPEVLDPALLRPGRFDRQVVVPLPSLSERLAILSVHARTKHLGPEVDLDVIARGTPGFSGADLANLLNEAAIHAVRTGRSVIEPADLDAARDRVLLGRRESSFVLLPDERESVSVHEAGHAIVAELCEHADPVAKVTILPAGRALGATEQLPAAERRLYTEDHLRDLMTVRMGGRAAELVAFGVASTGAADDLVAATAVAHRMVTEFGFSSLVGPVGHSDHDEGYLPGRPPWSETTQRIVDEEVTRLLREAEARAISLLRTHHLALDRLSALLREVETVDGAEVEHVLAASAPPTPSPRPGRSGRTGTSATPTGDLRP